MPPNDPPDSTVTGPVPVAEPDVPATSSVPCLTSMGPVKAVLPYKLVLFPANVKIGALGNLREPPIGKNF